ncbi:MAG: hypothetical protein AAFX56_09830 [Pseudomonadota bacterium]
MSLTLRKTSLQHGRAVVPLLLLLAVAVLIGGTLVAGFDRVHLYNDSFQHASAARSLADGDGYKTAIVYYEQNYAQRAMPVAQTVWPPGIAAMSSVFVLAGVDAATAVFTVSLLGLLLCPFLLLATGRRLELSRVATTAVALSSVALGLLVFITSRAGTEGPFVAATLLALFGAARLGKSEVPAWPGLAALAVGATLAVTIRYNGLFLVLSTGFWFVLLAILHRRWLPIVHAFAALLPAAALGMFILLRNYSLSGSLTGGPVSESWAAPVAVLRKLVEASISTVGLNPSQPLQLAALGVLALSLLLLVVWLPSYLLSCYRPKAETRTALYGRGDVVLFCLSYVLVSMTMLLLVLAPRALDALGYRYLLPLIPFAALLFALVVRERPGRLGQAGLLLFVGLVLVGNALALCESRERMLADQALTEVTSSLDAVMQDGTPLGDWLDARVGRDSPLLSSSSQRLGGLTGWPMLGLTPGMYSLSDWTTPEVQRIVADYGVCYVLLHANDTESRNGGGRLFFRDLREQRVPAWLEAVHEDEFLTVYEVDRCAGGTRRSTTPD